MTIKATSYRHQQVAFGFVCRSFGLCRNRRPGRLPSTAIRRCIPLKCASAGAVSGSSYTLRFTATVSITSGYAGIQADQAVICDLLRAGNARAYEPYECFDVAYPDGQRTSFGRIAHSGVTWDEEFQVFSVN